MFALLQQDEYLSSEITEQGHVQTMQHITFTRGVGALAGSPEQADELWNMHAEAIRFLDRLGTALKTTSTELIASIKALKQAKALEKKELEKEETRKRQAAERAAAAQKRKEDRLKAAAEAAATTTEQETTKEAKKRRTPAKLSEELIDSDPPVLKARFPDHQLTICENIET